MSDCRSASLRNVIIIRGALAVHYAKEVLHRSSTVVAVVGEISPNSNFELAREVEVVALA
jgi:hypothetical protein